VGEVDRFQLFSVARVVNATKDDAVTGDLAAKGQRRLPNLPKLICPAAKNTINGRGQFRKGAVPVGFVDLPDAEEVRPLVLRIRQLDDEVLCHVDGLTRTG